MSRLLQANKFKPGDIVIGNADAKGYGVTTTGTKWLVIEHSNPDHIFIRSLSVYKEEYGVLARSFDLYEAAKPVDMKGLTKVFVHKTYNKYTVENDNGETEVVDDILLFNATFTKVRGKRGVTGYASEKFNRHIHGILLEQPLITWKELKYKKDSFARPHYIHMSGQPKDVGILYLKNNKIVFKGTEHVYEGSVRSYLTDNYNEHSNTEEATTEREYEVEFDAEVLE